MSQTPQHIASSAEPYYVASAGDFFQLMKPRVMSLVVFTGFAGMYLAPSATEASLSVILLGAISLFAIAAGAGASGAINQWYDRDIDAVMTRTMGRPIPSGRVQSEEALALGLVISVLSVLLLSLSANLLAGGLLAFTIFFYAVIYSIWLKRRTPQNIVIGGAAGALPPMVGWAAMTGTVSLESVLLFAIIFIWTPPHFWALALLKNKDYIDNNIPMMPAVAGSKNTRIQIFAYALIMAIFAALPALLGYAGLFYALFSTALSTLFIAMSFWLLIAPDERQAAAAKALFAYSIFYLFLLFAGFPADKLIGI